MSVPRTIGRLVVLGLGTTGEAVARWGLEAGREHGVTAVVVIDSGDSESLERRAAALRAAGASVVLGSSEIPACDLIIASPGIRPDAELMLSARASSVPIISEIELAYRVSHVPWVAVTGTNGKTTTTALVTHLLREAGFDAEPVGNIGTPAIAIVPEMDEDGIAVAEVSSFQLAGVVDFHPRVAVLLNITPDHIDYHGSLGEYMRAKARIFASLGPGDTAVIDVDDPGSAPYAAMVAATGVDVVSVSGVGVAGAGARTERGALVLERAGEIVELVDTGDLALRGAHNISNALAAAAAAAAVGADVAAVRRGLTTFAPIEHRLEPVDVVDGVEWVNDSKATNPDAVTKALTAFPDRRIVLLLGGRNKGVDLGPIARRAAERCYAAVLFGEASTEFARALARTSLMYETAAGLAEAVHAAAAIAEAGDVVLLSPGCTSFDEFGGYEERGRAFKALVADLGGIDS